MSSRWQWRLTLPVRLGPAREPAFDRGWSSFSRKAAKGVFAPQSSIGGLSDFRNSNSGPDCSQNISISSRDSAMCVVNKYPSRATIFSQVRYNSADAVKGAWGARPIPPRLYGIDLRFR